MNPLKAYLPIKYFEDALCEYTGAPYAVTTNSCTMALLLAVKWNLYNHGNSWRCYGDVTYNVEIPRLTYNSVPMSIVHAGGRPTPRDEDWTGAYELKPLDVWDSARYFTANLWKIYRGMVCVSFHASKTLGDSQGGAILHDNLEADAWLRRMRFDGRTEGVHPSVDNFREVGYHCPMYNDVAARLLLKLCSLPKYNAPLPNDNYPDWSKMEIFK